MLENLRHYAEKLCDTQAKIQSKLDDMEVNDHNEETYNNREEQIEALGEILDAFRELIDLVEDYNSQWKGIKSIK